MLRFMHSCCLKFFLIESSVVDMHLAVRQILGEDWENAWNKYVNNWKSPCRPSESDLSCFRSSKRVQAMNHDKFNRKYHPWTNTHITSCHYNPKLVAEKGETIFLRNDISNDFAQPADPRRMLSYEGIEYGHEGFTALPRGFIVLSNSSHYNGRPCKVLDSSEATQTFDVVYILGETRDNVGTRKLVRLKDVPAPYIRFQVRPFHSDMMRAGAFRHELAFPDEYFPSLWKDLELGTPTLYEIESEVGILAG